MDISQMTPRRPYMLRAFYEWLVDNELTPHLVVEAELPGVRVPEQFIQDGQIILNIAPRAVGNLEMSNEAITFNARFGGTPHSVIVPMHAVQAIYARENGAGTMFEPEEAYLTEIEQSADLEEDTTPAIFGVESQDASSENTEPDPGDSPVKPKGRPSLKIVK